LRTTERDAEFIGFVTAQRARLLAVGDEGAGRARGRLTDKTPRLRDAMSRNRGVPVSDYLNSIRSSLWMPRNSGMASQIVPVTASCAHSWPAGT